MTDLRNLCNHFQLDLSRLVDGEIGSDAAARALVHLESCQRCRDFFDDTRRCAEVHRDLAEPERLFARLAILTGRDQELDLEGIDLRHRLATIFYRLGKAYVLVATSAEYRQRVFEKAVPVVSEKLRGRGFVDGVVLRGQGRAGGLDWGRARGLLNGQLDRIAEPLEKGRRLLGEAVRVDPSHEEARLWMANLHVQEGKRLLAQELYRDVFRTAVDETNRGHAAMQLGLLWAGEGEYRRAIACFRWVTASGLSERDGRFFPAHFNIGMDWAHLGRVDRSLQAFRTLLDRHPERVTEVAELFHGSPRLRQRIDETPGFGERLVATCPELFGARGASSPTPDTTNGSEQGPKE